MERLQKAYGRPKPPVSTDPFELILWENIAYLANDAERARAFTALRKQIGTTPGSISAASGAELLAVTQQGRGFAAQCAEKLRRADHIALTAFQGNLKKVLQLPFAQAKKALQKFPGIGEPGAEKILLFSSAYPVLALDSNGLRVLCRLGFAEERNNYGATYRAAQEAVKNEIRTDAGWLTAAHQLLRRHGQELCKTNRPLCHACPLTDVCRFYRAEATQTLPPAQPADVPKHR
jgi:endonuclease III